MQVKVHILVARCKIVPCVAAYVLLRYTYYSNLLNKQQLAYKISSYHKRYVGPTLTLIIEQHIHSTEYSKYHIIDYRPYTYLVSICLYMHWTFVYLLFASTDQYSLHDNNN